MSIKNMRNLNLPHEPKLDRDATQTSGKADEECECHILFNKRVNSNPMRKNYAALPFVFQLPSELVAQSASRVARLSAS